MSIAEAIVQAAQVTADAAVLCKIIDAGTFLLFVSGVIGSTVLFAKVMKD